MKQISRRAMLGTAATMVTTAAFAEPLLNHLDRAPCKLHALLSAE
jgi:hypothetical protein